MGAEAAVLTSEFGSLCASLAHPPSHRWGTICMTILDTLDTLWIAGMKDEFDKASEWVEAKVRMVENRSSVSSIIQP